jgi:hypothetical protein
MGYPTQGQIHNAIEKILIRLDEIEKKLDELKEQKNGQNKKNN